VFESKLIGSYMENSMRFATAVNMIALFLASGREVFIGATTHSRGPISFACFTGPRDAVDTRRDRLRPAPLHAQSDGLTSDDPPRTIYTLDDASFPPPDPALLATVVRRHIRGLPTYLRQRPVSAHTADAYRRLACFLDTSRPGWRDGGMVLDAGCGTGRSSRLLGEKYPDKIVVGVDRSISRLRRDGEYRRDADDGTPLRPYGDGSDNVFLLRADLEDFYRLAATELPDDGPVRLHAHYLLYPNPYPKPRRHKNRWHFHPVFPLILALGGEKIVVRSNWRGYCEQFGDCVILASTLARVSPIRSVDDGVLREENWAAPYESSARIGPRRLHPEDGKAAMTNFEKKFIDCGEPIYELELERCEREEIGGLA